MHKPNPFRLALVLCLLSITVTACKGSKDDVIDDLLPASDQGLLRYIPADTPYLFAMLEPLPDEVADKFEPKLEEILTAYRDLLRTMVETRAITADKPAEGEASSQDPAEVVEELSELLSVEGFRSAGITRETTAVIYGAGLLPVMRMTVSDGDLMEATIARIEAKSTEPMSVATIDGQPYRYAGDDKAQLVVAVVEDEFVLSIVPTGLSKDLLKSVLGLALPASSLADTDKLQKLIHDNGFKPYSIGFIDFERIAATFLDSPSGLNAEFLKLVAYDSAQLSDVCRAEIRALAAVAPRIITGYSEMSAEKFTSNTIIELRPDLAAGLAKLTAPVPGLGREQGGLFAFGMSLDIPATREFYASRLDAMEAKPYRCESFANLQDGVTKGRQALNQPIPPIAYGFKGFLAVVEDIEGMDLANKRPPTSADVRLLVSTDNAAGLLAMGAMFSPEIAALDLQPNGKPVRFESPQLAGVVDAAYVAMTESALALSIGAGTENRLGDMLSAGIGNPPPFISMEMDAARYYDFVAEAVTANDDKEDATPPELQAAISKLMRLVGDMFSRITVRVEFTERGIEIPSTILLSK